MDEAHEVASTAKVGIVKFIVIGAAGLLYAYAVWAAVAYCISFAQIGLNAYGVFLMVFAIALPIFVFAVAFSFRARLSAFGLLLVQFAGLGIVSAFWMNVVAYTALNPDIFALT